MILTIGSNNAFSLTTIYGDIFVHIGTVLKNDLG